MESTTQYWRPGWNGLEAHFRLHLCHPLKVRAPRGRKQDYRDAQRLADRWWSGDLEDRFIPGAEQRQWRWLTRTRAQLRRLIGVVRNRVEGLLEQGGIKLTAVATDPFGVCWAMLKLLAQGETDGAVLAGQALGRLRHKEGQLREALSGKLEPVYQLLLQQNREQVELLRRQIEETNQALSTAMQAPTATVVRLSKIPGVDLGAAQGLLAEIGPGATAFALAERLAGWGCVQAVRNPRRLLQPSLRQGKPLSQASAVPNCLGRHSHQRFVPCRSIQPAAQAGSQGCRVGVAHRIAKLVWLLLHEGVEYEERGSPPNPRALVGKFRRGRIGRRVAGDHDAV